MNNWNKIIGGALLIAGTTIGAGMLALPVVTAPSGFYPTLGICILSWIFMLVSAVLILEANLWFPERTNLLTMTRATLGKSGLIVALIFFALLLYAVNSAYITASSGLITSLIDSWSVQYTLIAILLTLVMGAIVYFGTITIDYSNRVLMAILIITYFLLIFAIAPHIESAHFAEVNPSHLPMTWIIVILSFAYQFIIPNIRGYIGSNSRHLIITIMIGSVIPLILYTVWTAAIAGSLPLEGEHGLLALRANGEPVAGLSSSLLLELNLPWVSYAFNIFSLCALLTSILGVSWSMVGLWYDITQTKNDNPRKHLLFVVLTFLPPLFFALFFQKGFEIALRYGGIFVVVLLGLLPALMVWSGRYKTGLAQASQFKVWGGKYTLVIMIAISIILIVLECENLWGWVN
jgi:tyrosine-specific transport protein